MKYTCAFSISFALLIFIWGLFLLVDHRNLERYACAEAQIQEFIKGIEIYKEKKGVLPEVLDKLFESGIMSGEIPLDPWGNSYLYLCSNGTYRVMSYGEDGKPGGINRSKDIIYGTQIEKK